MSFLALSFLSVPFKHFLPFHSIFLTIFHLYSFYLLVFSSLFAIEYFQFLMFLVLRILCAFFSISFEFHRMSSLHGLWITPILLTNFVFLAFIDEAVFFGSRLGLL